VLGDYPNTFPVDGWLSSGLNVLSVVDINDDGPISEGFGYHTLVNTLIDALRPLAA
jgi:hypothetical protein